jgi:hypothetical protein
MLDNATAIVVPLAGWGKVVSSDLGIGLLAEMVCRSKGPTRRENSESTDGCRRVRLPLQLFPMFSPHFMNHSR